MGGDLAGGDLADAMRGSSERDFLARFGTGEQCLAVQFELRWGQGFTGEHCGCEKYTRMKSRQQPSPPQKAVGLGVALPPRSLHKQRLSLIICLHTNSETMRHIPTHFRSGCAATRPMPREMNRYMTPDPRNESIYAPLALLMAHRSTHSARQTCERTHGSDDRTRGIDDRTRPGDEGTRHLRRNPSGRIVAGRGESWRYYNGLRGSAGRWSRSAVVGCGLAAPCCRSTPSGGLQIGPNSAILSWPTRSGGPARRGQGPAPGRGRRRGRR